MSDELCARCELYPAEKINFGLKVCVRCYNYDRTFPRRFPDPWIEKENYEDASTT